MGRLSAALALLLDGSCSYSLEVATETVRAERVALEKSLPADAPLWVSEGPDRFDPYLDDHSFRIPDFIYLHLVRKLHALTPAETDALSQGDLDVAAALKEPARFRGRVWRSSGLIAELHTEPVGDRAVPRAHAGIFFTGKMQPVIFHVIEKPDVLTLREDHVETRGIFVKLIEYPTKAGGTAVAPLIVGKTLRRIL